MNRETTMIRNAVTGWINRNNPESFTVTLLLSELGDTLKAILINTDLSKAMSNELKRRERLGWLECIGVEVIGLGRPPKVYRQKWRM